MEEFKYSMVGWDTVCSPIELGSLGIKQTGLFNQALLVKWLLHFRHEDTQSVVLSVCFEVWSGRGKLDLEIR